MAYSDKVLDRYNNPRNVDSLTKEDPNVGTGLVGAPECGDVMKLQIKVKPETFVLCEQCGWSAKLSSAEEMEEPIQICPRCNTAEFLEVKEVEVIA